MPDVNHLYYFLTKGWGGGENFDENLSDKVSQSASVSSPVRLVVLINRQGTLFSAVPFTI